MNCSTQRAVENDRNPRRNSRFREWSKPIVSPSLQRENSPLVGALADTLGYGPLFGLPGVFDLVGTAALIILIGGERHAERFATA